MPLTCILPQLLAASRFEVMTLPGFPLLLKAKDDIALLSRKRRFREDNQGSAGSFGDCGLANQWRRQNESSENVSTSQVKHLMVVTV